MLVYSRRQRDPNVVEQAAEQAAIQPPSRALESVQKLDLAHEIACGEFLKKYVHLFAVIADSHGFVLH